MPVDMNQLHLLSWFLTSNYNGAGVADPVPAVFGCQTYGLLQ